VAASRAELTSRADRLPDSPKDRLPRLQQHNGNMIGVEAKGIWQCSTSSASFLSSDIASVLFFLKFCAVGRWPQKLFSAPNRQMFHQECAILQTFTKKSDYIHVQIIIIDDARSSRAGQSNCLAVCIWDLILLLLISAKSVRELRVEIRRFRRH
jgi:hypothetical protein